MLVDLRGNLLDRPACRDALEAVSNLGGFSLIRRRLGKHREQIFRLARSRLIRACLRPEDRGGITNSDAATSVGCQQGVQGRRVRECCSLRDGGIGALLLAVRREGVKVE